MKAFNEVTISLADVEKFWRIVAMAENWELRSMQGEVFWAQVLGRLPAARPNGEPASEFIDSKKTRQFIQPSLPE
jgi:hypothetical protein